MVSQRLCKQAKMPELSLGNESASNNRGPFGGSVFCTVRAEAIKVNVFSHCTSLH
jgi:hypothetical protein